MRTVLLSVALACAAAGQVSAPDAAEQATMISRMREAALSYSDQLQNFICTQVTTRSIASSPTATRWKLLETRDLELAYVDHKEHYRLLKVNGETTDLEKRIKRGYFKSSGEFGSDLYGIFHPKVNADFEWDHAEPSGTGSLCVFRYRVPQATSTWQIYADGQQRTLGYRGMIWGDSGTGAVMRVQIETDTGKVTVHGFHVSIAERVDVRYGPVTIGSKEFLLPQSAVVLAQFHKTWTKAEIQFQEYRKYDANSNIKFDEPDKR